MKKKLRMIIFAAVLIFSMSAILYSCKTDSKNTGDANESTNVSENAAETAGEPEISDNLPQKNYDGYNFRIYMRSTSYRNEDFYTEGENGDLINDAVYKRNKKIEDRFNINIVPVLYDNEFDTGAKQTILAGDDAYDLIALHGVHSFQYAENALVLDWLTDMPYVNFDMPWWRDDIAKGFAAFGKLYCVTGDFSHLSVGSGMCLMFNKNLFKSLNIAYPYEDVINGKWTFDKFFEINKSAGADLNGDGAMTDDADRFGFFIYNEWDYPIAVLYCGGDRIISLDDAKTPVLSLYNDRTVDIFDKFFNMMNTTGAAYLGAMDIDPNSIDVFTAGRALFECTGLRAIPNYRAMEEDIGILPLPKYADNTPEYYNPSEAGANLFTVPITATDLDRTSIIVEALCSEGYKTVIPAFYEKSLKTKYSRDDESANMLDYIKNGLVYDYGYYNNTLTGPLAFIGQMLVTAKNPNFTSFYEKREKAVQSNIDKLKDMN